MRLKNQSITRILVCYLINQIGILQKHPEGIRTRKALDPFDNLLLFPTLEKGIFDGWTIFIRH